MQISKRHLLAAPARHRMTFERAASALGAERTLSGSRNPDSRSELCAGYRLALAGVERIAAGMRWCEGPVYFGDARCLLWSDIPNNRIMRWDEETGRGERVPQAVQQCQRQYPRPPGPAGHLRARQPPPHPHRVRRHHHRADRQVRGQAAQFAERRGWSKSDDSIWFTDPPFGILGNYEGHVATRSCRPTSIDSTGTGRATVCGGRHQPAERARLLARRIEEI